MGLTDYKSKTIYLDKGGGTPRVLVHELCHFVLGTVLERAARNLAWKDLKKMKGRTRADKRFEWEELRTQEFEKLFYRSLNKEQIEILRGFINVVREGYEE